VAISQLHFWEEPPISGTKGSGTVFFSGCNMRCVYCQNHEISRNHLRLTTSKQKSPAKINVGKEMTPEELAQVFFDLAYQGAHNINLVTPTPYIPQIRVA
jgi:putative pyruvate formate lyase activating enzyme